MIKQCIFISIISILLLSCTCAPSSELERALLLSKNNRKELEKVLDHYSCSKTDSLKYKAAVFLIENMPKQYSYSGSFIEKFKIELNKHRELSFLSRKVIEILPFRYIDITSFLQYEHDIEIIKSDFLIYYIDYAFKLLGENPWLNQISFEDFCDYILPYRISHEALDQGWKDSLRQPLEGSLKEIIVFHDDKKYSSFHWSRNLGLMFDLHYASKDFNIANVHFERFECQNSSLAKLFFYRAIGVPAALEYIPAWANSNGHHYWVTIIDPRLRDAKFEEIVERKAPKIYRRTYSYNEIPMPTKKEYIPAIFKEPFYRDVTANYMNTSDVNIEIDNLLQIKNDYGYLAVFNDLILRPVCWGKIENKKICFKSMGRDIVYFPIYYQNNEIHNMDYPFILYANGTTRKIIPDLTQKQKIYLKRKCPINSEKTVYGKKLIGGYFECSNDVSFKNATIVHHIVKNPNLMCTKVPICVHGKFRFWRFRNDQSADIAEISFFAKKQEIKGEVLTNDTLMYNLCDNNPLTYSSIRNVIVFDMGQPVSVTEIRYLPRNDANGIYPNNEYELFYYSIKGWESLGVKVANDDYIVFDSVPLNSLLWLHNRTTGREERIFTYEDGQQRFW